MVRDSKGYSLALNSWFLPFKTPLLRVGLAYAELGIAEEAEVNVRGRYPRV